MNKWMYGKLFDILLFTLYIIYFGFAYLIMALWRRNFLLNIQNGSVQRSNFNPCPAE